MIVDWDRETLRAAVRQTVKQVPAGDDEVPARVELDGDDLLVTFRWPGEPHLFGVRFRLSAAPEGPSTGEICESPEEWAWEVSLVLMEELDTGLVQRGRRTVRPNGVVELDYRINEDEYEPRTSPGPPALGRHPEVRIVSEKPPSWH